MTHNDTGAGADDTLDKAHPLLLSCSQKGGFRGHRRLVSRLDSSSHVLTTSSTEARMIEDKGSLLEEVHYVLEWNRMPFTL